MTLWAFYGAPDPIDAFERAVTRRLQRIDVRLTRDDPAVCWCVGNRAFTISAGDTGCRNHYQKDSLIGAKYRRLGK